MTYNFLQLYEKQDGTQQDWNPIGGDDLTEKLSELDRRFHQSTAPVGSYWNADIPMVNSFVGGRSQRRLFWWNMDYKILSARDEKKWG